MLRKLGIALLSIGFALALCEGLLRVFGANVLPRPDLYTMDPVVGKRMKPGWEGAEFEAPVKISSQGLRNRETPYAKPLDTFRILALGDSWTFGFRMSEPDSYPRQLERILNERAAARGDARKIEVINAGVIGYSTDQEAAYFRSEGKRFEPDLIVLAYYPVNDTHNKLYKYARYERLKELHPWLLELYLAPRELYLRQFWKGARRTLKQRWREWRADAAQRAGAHPTDVLVLREEDWTSDYREGARGWEAVRAALAELGRETRASGRPALVVLLPDADDLVRYHERFHPKIEPMVRRAAGDAGLDWFDLEPVFAPWQRKEDEIRFKSQRHPNARGYQLIAEAVALEVERRYLPGLD